MVPGYTASCLSWLLHVVVIQHHEIVLMKGGFQMTARRRSGERGQILVLFTLALISLLAMVGLILDGGDTFAQRRDQQNGADLAAMDPNYASGLDSLTARPR